MFDSTGRNPINGNSLGTAVNVSGTITVVSDDADVDAGVVRGTVRYSTSS